MTARSFAIVGASLAGARAAQALRRQGFDGRIHLIGAEEHAPYDRPPLSKGVLIDGLDPASTALEPEAYWADEQIELHLGRPVVALHPAERQVELAGGDRIAADRVLLTTGGRARRLPVAGADLAGVHCLRTLDDAVGIGEGLVDGAHVLVVGAGFIGAEVAAAARSRGCAVTLVEIAEVPLARVLGVEMGEFYGRVHRDRGVRLLTGVGVVELRGDTAVREAVLGDGTTIPVDLVVVGVGIEPSTELAAAIGAEVGNGIVVDEYCETTVPGVYAAGDVANHPNGILGGRVRLEHWRNAQNQAAAAASSMLGRPERFCEVPWFWSDQYELKLQVAGHPHPGDEVVRRGADGTAFSAFYLRDGVVRAVVGVNRPGDVRAGMDLIAHHVGVGPDLLRDEGTDLRALARAARTTAAAAS